MKRSYQSDKPSRQVILISGTSLLGFGMAILSPVLLGGCGEDKSQMTRVENPEDPTVKAKASMEFYRQSKLNKGGTAKSGNQGR